MSLLQCFNHKREKPRFDGEINCFLSSHEELMKGIWDLCFLKLFNICEYTYLLKKLLVQ